MKPQEEAPVDNLIGEIAAAFGERLKAVRRHRNIMQAAFGRKLGVSRTTVSNIETGRQRVYFDQVVRAALILDVPLSELLPTFEDLPGDGIQTAADNPLPETARGGLQNAISEIAAERR